MTDPFLRFPDVARLLSTDLETLAGVGRTGGQTPANLEELLPFIRILRTGGSSDHVSDRPIVWVDVFAATYAAGEVLAEQVRQRLVGPPPPIPALDKVRCDTAPRELPWGDPAVVRRFQAIYAITTRRRLTV